MLQEARNNTYQKWLGLTQISHEDKALIVRLQEDNQLLNEKKEETQRNLELLSAELNTQKSEMGRLRALAIKAEADALIKINDEEVKQNHEEVKQDDQKNDPTEAKVYACLQRDHRESRKRSGWWHPTRSWSNDLNELKQDQLGNLTKHSILGNGRRTGDRTRQLILDRYDIDTRAKINNPNQDFNDIKKDIVAKHEIFLINIENPQKVEALVVKDFWGVHEKQKSWYSKSFLHGKGVDNVTLDMIVKNSIGLNRPEHTGNRSYQIILDRYGVDTRARANEVNINPIKQDIIAAFREMYQQNLPQEQAPAVQH